MIEVIRAISKDGALVLVNTHDRVDIDELIALWLAERFATRDFFAKYCPDSTLELGVGGGAFDEHSRDGKPRKEGECCATLMAKALGFEMDDAILEPIIRFALTSDGGGNQPFDIASFVKIAQDQGHSVEKVIEWVFFALDIKYQAQLQFWGPTKEEFEQKAKVQEIDGPHGKITLVSIESDDPNVSKFARARNAAIIVQRQSTGNTQIFTNKKFGLVLYDVAQMINIAEQETEDRIRMKICDWTVLAAEGTIPNGRWYFQIKGQMLMNGSLTHNDVPPTKLSLEKILEIVRIGINPKAFEESRAMDCREGICTSTLENQCSWYRYGLHRCRQIRYRMKGDAK